MAPDPSQAAATQPAGSVFDDEEDNNPFSNTQGLASLMSDHRNSLGRQAGSNGHTKREGGELQGGDKFEDDASLLLYNSSSNNQAEVNSSPNKDTFNTIYINYESRVTKLLRPGSNPKIQITEAGNSNEGMLNSLKKYIVYTIKLLNGDDASDEIQTRRRYSDFESLRDVLTKVFPLVIVPPIPPKNFLGFGVLNGLVSQNILQSTGGVANGTGGSSANGNVASNGVGGSPSNYSYINSTHLNKNKLIEHRKRLLSNFLNNCLSIPQIRNLEFFAKFLDPNANWSDEITLITSQLPKSIYLLNPENGLKTDPLYENLPLPVSNHSINIPFFKDNKKKITKKTNKLLGKQSQQNNDQEESPNELSRQTSPTNTVAVDANGGGDSNNKSNYSVGDEYIIATSRLDDINKKIMDNFIGLANDYTELGTAFNSFSLILSDLPITRTSKIKLSNDSSVDDRENTKLNMVFEKIGQVFDRSYITINSLIGDLETKFSEPLGEAVKYSDILTFINSYTRRKIRQQKLLDSEIKHKKEDLFELLKQEQESARIDGAINSHAIQTDHKYDFSSTNNEPALNQTETQQANKSKFKFFPSMNQFKKITQYVTEIIDQNPEQTRRQRIAHLQNKITLLEKCQKIMLEDVSYITDEVDKNFKQFHQKELKVIYEILLTYNGFLISWAKKNIDIWEEIKEEVEKL